MLGGTQNEKDYTDNIVTDGGNVNVYGAGRVKRNSYAKRSSYGF